MRTLTAEQIENAVYLVASEMCFDVDREVQGALKEAYEKENGKYAKLALSDILENIKIAREKHLPVCQDTGIVIAFAEVGSELVVKGNFENAVNNAVRRAYVDNYLRKSVVRSPVDRVNTKDNSPAIIHVRIVEGDGLKITLCPKGAGSENMGRVKMLTPAAGIDGIIDFVTETVKLAGGKACPPLIVGVGIGGDMEQCAVLSKKALLRPVSDVSTDKTLAELEKNLLQKINGLNIGAMGLKGTTTALAVKIEAYPCHIASLPVAVSLMCHAVRHAEVKL